MTETLLEKINIIKSFEYPYDDPYDMLMDYESRELVNIILTMVKLIEDLGVEASTLDSYKVPW